jgi:hypothetical protein
MPGMFLPFGACGSFGTSLVPGGLRGFGPEGIAPDRPREGNACDGQGSSRGGPVLRHGPEPGQGRKPLVFPRPGRVGMPTGDRRSRGAGIVLDGRHGRCQGMALPMGGIGVTARGKGGSVSPGNFRGAARVAAWGAGELGQLGKRKNAAGTVASMPDSVYSGLAEMGYVANRCTPCRPSPGSVPAAFRLWKHGTGS